MSTNITSDNLEKIFTKWDRYEVPSSAQDKISELVLKTTQKMFDLVDLVGSFDEDTSFAMGEKLGEVVMRPFVLCYYIGYELASAKMSGAEGTPYLMAATEPIEDFVLNIVKILLAKGSTNKETLRAMALEISRLIGDASNEICVLGIENFRRIGHK